MDTVFSRYIHPVIIPFYEEIPIDDKRIAIITIGPGTSKPYVVRNNNREDLYVRIGSVSKLATREQQAGLFAVGGMLHTEIMPVPGTSIESLDKVRLENYLYDILREPEKITSPIDFEKRLKDLGFLTIDSNRKTVCTIAGLVLFGVNPRSYIRHSGVRIMAFEGIDLEYRALLDEILDGPLVGRWKIDKNNSRQLIDTGLIEKLTNALRPYIIDESDTINENLRREKKYIYPIEAIRETVVNAFAHRDWTRFSDVEVTRYSNRIEITSPGAFPNSMTIEKMIAGLRTSRNPIIVEVLRDYGYADARGMGVRKKVIPLIREYSGKEPVFEASDDRIKTILPSGSAKVETVNSPGSTYFASLYAPLSKLQEEIIEIITDDPYTSYDKIAEKTQKNRTTVMRNINKLKKLNIISRAGSRKTGKWIINT
jgi:ATP-dependent DNA helicase RecG